MTDIRTKVGLQDSFARSRVSTPRTLFGSKQIFDNQPLFWDDAEVSGSGTTSVYSKDSASTRIGVSLNTPGNRTRQTFQRFNYQAGKSQLVLMSVVMCSKIVPGIKTTAGLFDDNNGIYFTVDETILKAGLRSSVSGSVVNNEVSQSDFNIDTLDGNGASEITIDPTAMQIIVFDFEWLGTGTIRIGFVVNGTIYYCHQYSNANVLSTAYMSTPNLPLRYEIINNGVGEAITMDHVSTTVISEGGSQELGITRYASTEGTHITATTENIIYAIIGIKLKPTNIAATIKIKSIDIQLQNIADATIRTGEWIWVLNPTIAGSFTYSDETNSSVQIATGATPNTVTNGTNISGGFAQFSPDGVGSAISDTSIDNARHLGSKIDSTIDEMVLCWRPNGGTGNHGVEGSITWKEIS